MGTYCSRHLANLLEKQRKRNRCQCLCYNISDFPSLRLHLIWSEKLMAEKAYICSIKMQEALYRALDKMK